MPEAPDLETWKANGRIVLQKFNRLGGVEEVLVNSGRTVHLSAEERLINQERVIDESLDPFLNGTMSAVRLPESSAESTQAIIESPNAMGEEELVEMFDLHHTTFEKRLGEITSPYVINRMIAMAREDENDSLKASVNQVEKLERRLQELTIGDDITLIEHVGPDS